MTIANILILFSEEKSTVRKTQNKLTKRGKKNPDLNSSLRNNFHTFKM